MSDLILDPFWHCALRICPDGELGLLLVSYCSGENQYRPVPSVLISCGLSLEARTPLTR
jgi:hypothetical protein